MNHRITIRLTDTDLEELDSLVVLYNTRGPNNRAGVLRSLIRQAHKDNRDRIARIRDAAKRKRGRR